MVKKTVVAYLVSVTVIFAESIDPALDVLQWYSHEWDEYGDASDYSWNNEEWLLNINRLSVFQLSILPGLDMQTASKIVREREKNGDFKSLIELEDRVGLPLPAEVSLGNSTRANLSGPFTGRIHLKMNRRWSNKTENRFNGDPLALTQRYRCTFGRCNLNCMIDKDSFEPSILDLSRFSLVWQEEHWSVIAGDFHVTSGQGLSVWTRPDYLFSFDSPSHFRRSGRGIQPAMDQVENSALRGIGINGNPGNLDINLFASSTAMDAIKGNANQVLRLSNSGLHRTEKESMKNDAVTERLIGGTIALDLPRIGEMAHSIYLSGYSADYSPGFQPDISTRDRFPMEGKRFGSLGIGTVLTADRFNIYWETALDHRGHTAWIIGSRLHMAGLPRSSIDIMIYHYPTVYWNPRARSISSSIYPSNSDIASILLINRPKSVFMDYWKMLIETENRPWRSWNIPTSSRNSRCSLETGFRISERCNLVARYRHRSGVDGNGEESEVEEYVEDRWKLTLKDRFSSAFLKEMQVWFETARFSRIKEGYSSGYLIGCDFEKVIKAGKRLGETVQVNLRLNWFWSENGLPLYSSEANLPDRIASVRLSGRGVRLSNTLTVRKRKSCWIGAEWARTWRMDDPGVSGDFELYLTLSYRTSGFKSLF